MIQVRSVRCGVMRSRPLYRRRQIPPGVPSTLPGIPVPLSFFGIHNIKFHDAALRPTFPFGTLRLWDTGVSWADLEPTQGAWNFSRLDFALQVAGPAGYEVILTLARTPQWASSNPSGNSFYGPGQAAPPSDLNDWATYVRTVGARYAGRIAYYEIWNEPHSSGFWSGSSAQLVELARIAREELAIVDPSARVISPPPAKPAGLSWFASLLTAGIADHVDILGYHLYTDSDLPEARVRLIRDVRKAMAAHGLGGRVLWDTESSRNIADASGDSAYASRTAHMARWLILTWANGVERTCWHTWAANPRGFVDPDTKVPRTDVITAYMTVQGWMLGSVFRSCSPNGVLWTCNMTLASGEDAALYWTQDASSRAVAVAPSVRVEDLTGATNSVTTGSVTVTGDPVLVVAV